MSRYEWDEFIDLYINNHVELMFFYKRKEYHLSFGDDEMGNLVAYLSIGTKKKGYETLEFSSAENLLKEARIDGKTFREIWDELY